MKKFIGRLPLLALFASVLMSGFFVFNNSYAEELEVAPELPPVDSPVGELSPEISVPPEEPNPPADGSALEEILLPAEEQESEPETSAQEDVVSPEESEEPEVPVGEPELPVEEDEEPADEQEENSEPELLPSPSSVIVSEWTIVDGTKFVTSAPVVVGKTYVAPTNDAVTVTFTRLPEIPGTLTIEEITISEELAAAIGSASTTLYDITSDMEDGTFEYTLTLPAPAEVQKATVEAAESVETAEASETVAEDLVVENSVVTIEGLDHFTVFIIVDDGDENHVDCTDAFDCINVFKDYDWSSHNTGYNGDHRYVEKKAKNLGATSIWNFPERNKAGDKYAILLSWVVWDDHATNAKYESLRIGGFDAVTVNQKLMADGTSAANGTWSDWYTAPGKYILDKNDGISLTLRSDTNGNLSADAVAFVNLSEAEFINSQKTVEAYDASQLVAEFKAPNLASAGRFTINGETLDASSNKPGPESDFFTFKLLKSLPVGTYPVTAEYKLGTEWYPVNGEGSVTAVDTTLPVISIGNGNGNSNTGPDHEKAYSGKVDVYVSVYDNNLSSYHFRVVKDGSQLGSNCAIGSIESAENQGYQKCGYAYNSRVATSTSISNQIIVSLDTTQLGGDGEYWLIIGAGDSYGNRAAADYVNDPKVKIVVDNTKPVIQILAPVNDGDVVTGASDIVVKATDNIELKSITAHLYDGNNNAVPGVWQHPSVDGTEYTLTIPLAGLADGSYLLKAAAVDETGTAVYAARKFIIDNTAPVVAVTPAAGGWLRGTVTFDITVTDTNLDSSKLNRVWVYLYNQLPPQAQKGANVNLSGGHGAFTVDTTLLADGKANLDVARLFDAAGNASGTSDNYFRNYVIDNTAPEITVKPSPDSVGDFGNKTFSKVSFKLFDSSSVDKVVLNGVVKDLSDNKWSDLNDVGVHNWYGEVEGLNTLVLYDVAGNTATYAFTLDRTAPVAPTLVSPANNSFAKGNSLTNSWSSSDADVAYYVYESYHDELAANKRWTETVNAPKTSKTATGVSESVFWWRVKAVDKAGNVGPWSELWKVTVDNTAPVISLNGSGETASVYLDGEWDDPVSASDALEGDLTSKIVITGTVDTSTLGEYWLSYDVADSAGNAAERKTRKVNVMNAPRLNNGPQLNDGSSGNQGDQGGQEGQGGEVLGSETFRFTKDLWFGIKDSDVTELQKALKGEGLLEIEGFTDFFGTLTFKAVKGYQEKYGIPVTGYVGPMTRAQLNGEEVEGVEIDKKGIQEQINNLMKKLAELMALFGKK